MTYDFTNDSDKPLKPMEPFIECFNATQETEQTIDELDIAASPQGEKYEKLTEITETDVKPGATVQAVISFEINDISKPITLKATQGLSGKTLGEKVYNLN
ncbi:hypothetical protein CN403_23945 [Bacillus cereus]|nr:hypothetical protein CN403_23945 [Bacillus cereus]